MNWKIKFLIAAILIGCGVIFVKLPTQAQSNDTQASETLQNATNNYVKPNKGNVEGAQSSDAPATLFSYTGPPVAIPDNVPTGVDIVLPVAGSGNITDLDFMFDTGGACDATVGNYGKTRRNYRKYLCNYY
jgi:hypothetical protein